MRKAHRFQTDGLSMHRLLLQLYAIFLSFILPEKKPPCGDFFDRLGTVQMNGGFRIFTLVFT